jgi:hypothetical protein
MGNLETLPVLKSPIQMVESVRRDRRPPIFAHLACVVNAAGAGALAMMRRDVTLLHFEGSGEELKCRHPAKEELAHIGGGRARERDLHQPIPRIPDIEAFQQTPRQLCDRHRRHEPFAYRLPK